MDFFDDAPAGDGPVPAPEPGTGLLLMCCVLLGRLGEGRKGGAEGRRWEKMMDIIIP